MGQAAVDCLEAETLSLPVRALFVISAMRPPRPEMSTTYFVHLRWLCCRPPAYASCTRLKCGSTQHICWLYPGAATIWSQHGQPLGLACREAANGTASCRALQAPCPRLVSRLYLSIQHAHSTMHNSLQVAVCCLCQCMTLPASVQCTVDLCQ